MFVTGITASANDQREDMSSLEQVDQEMQAKIGDKSLTQERVQAAYDSLSEKNKSVLIKQANQNITKISKGETGSNSSYQIKSIGSNFTVTAETSDVSEDGSVAEENIPLLRAWSGYVTKNYGDRQYIINSGLNWNGIGLINSKLSMHYTLNSSGIKMRYSSTMGTYSWVGDVTCSAKTTDSVATKVGANVNAYGTYHSVYTVPGLGTQASHTFRIHGVVKLYSWNKSQKNMQLYEGWSEEA